VDSNVLMASLLGGLIGLPLGWAVFSFISKRNGSDSSAQAEQILASAEKQAETVKKSAELEAKEALFKARADAESASKKKVEELNRRREKLLRRESELESREESIAKKVQDVEAFEEKLKKRESNATSLYEKAKVDSEKAKSELQSVAGLSSEDAKKLLIDRMRHQANVEAAEELQRIELETNASCRERAVTMIATAIQREASEFVSERTVSAVQLPSDEMKGKIIGREGRNIRAIEAATGVDLIVDDTPETVIISCFSPLRREIGKVTLEKLIADGRIHPSRIDDAVARAKKEVAQSCKRSGEQAVYDLGLHKVHPEIIRALGEMKFLSTYTQNLLHHSITVGFLAGMIAEELGLNVKIARRAGLLHDIGKTAPQHVGGSHAEAGAAIAKKFGEHAKVVQAIAAHHEGVAPTSALDHIVIAANQISARRPGARKEQLASFVQRLDDIEQLCRARDGVEQAYAIQAGREVKVIVERNKIDDDMSLVLSKEIARQIETDLNYPGQIKVDVVRQSRAASIAR